MIKKIPFAIVVGHDQKDQGAFNYLNESEWSFNRRVGKKVQAILLDKGLSVSLVQKIPGLRYRDECEAVVEALRDLKVTHALELHFNWFVSEILGCEALVSSFGDSFKLAAGILNELVNRGFKHRGIKQGEGQIRGMALLKMMSQKGIEGVILEPCFGNFKTKESEFIFESEDLYCAILADQIETFHINFMKKSQDDSFHKPQQSA